ncbi:MAG: hypothetical protein ACK4QW_02350 [Alphaproteobacteria bacterium]
MNPQDGGTTERIAETASEAYDAARERATGLLDEVRLQVDLIASRQKAQFAGRIDGVAAAIRAAASELSAREQPVVAGYVAEVAEAVGGLSDTVRRRDIADFAQDAESLARRHPGLSLAGGVLLGFAAARFLRAVAESPRRTAPPPPASPPPEPDWAAGVATPEDPPIIGDERMG